MTNLSEIPTEELAAEMRRRVDSGAVTISSSPQDEKILSITRSVAGVFGVAMEGILGPSREGPLAEARFAAWLVLRDHGFMPCDIAPVFWRKDSGTVRHGCHRGRALIQTDSKFARRLKQALDLVSGTINKPCHQCIGVGRIHCVLPEPAGEFECNACNGSGLSTKSPQEEAA